MEGRTAVGYYSVTSALRTVEWGRLPGGWGTVQQRRDVRKHDVFAAAAGGEGEQSEYSVG
jgi:hypothetical protein